jgi:arylsulfatase
LRAQFQHVIDIAPTILEAAGLPEPTFVHGVQQKPIEGTSFRHTFDDAAAEERHTTQYFEMFGNRGIYHNGWTAVTKHRTPWLLGAIELPAFDDDNWELYNTNEDWSQVHDLAAENPQMLYELQRLWLIEAVKYQVLPMDDRTAERFNPEIAGRPDLMGDRTSMRLDAKMGRLNEAASPNVKNKSHSVTAEIVVPEGGAEGAIAVQGGRFGGWSFYMKEGKLKYCYNFIALEHSFVESAEAVAAGERQVRIEFKYDGGGVGKGADLTLYVDGMEVGSGRTEHSIPYLTSLDETLDIGVDDASPVTEDYSTKNARFTGKINWVQINLGLDDHSHMIDTDHMIHVRMAKQ